MGASKKKKPGKKQPGKAIWVKANPRQLELLEMIDPVFGATQGDRLLYCFQRFIEENGEGIFAPANEEEDEEVLDLFEEDTDPEEDG